MSIEVLDRMILNLMPINFAKTFYYQKKLNDIKNELIIPLSQKLIIKITIKKILNNIICNVENKMIMNEVKLNDKYI